MDILVVAGCKEHNWNDMDGPNSQLVVVDILEHLGSHRSHCAGIRSTGALLRCKDGEQLLFYLSICHRIGSKMLYGIDEGPVCMGCLDRASKKNGSLLTSASSDTIIRIGVRLSIIGALPNFFLAPLSYLLTMLLGGL